MKKFNLSKGGFVGIAVALALFGGAFTAASPASAATGDTVILNPEPKLISTASQVEFNADDASVSSGKVKLTSKIELKPMNAKGYKAKSPKKIAKNLVCDYKLTEKRYNALIEKALKEQKKLKASHSNKIVVITLGKGCIAQDRGRYASNMSIIQTFTHHFGEKANVGNERTTKYATIKKVTTKSGKTKWIIVRIECDNEILPVDKKDKKTEKDVTFTALYEYEATAVAEAAAKLESKYRLYAASPDGSCIIDIEVTITGDGSAKASAMARAKTKVKAEAGARTNLRGVAETYKGLATGRADASAAVKLSGAVKAAGYCTYTPPTTTPPVQAPLVSIEKANDLDVTKPNTTNDPNWEPSRQTIRVNYDFGTGTGTVFVNSDFGTVGVYDPTQKRIVKSSYENLSGRGFVDVTYVASTEAGTDKVSAHGVSNESKLRSYIVTSNTFIVNPSPVHPL